MIPMCEAAVMSGHTHIHTYTHTHIHTRQLLHAHRGLIIALCTCYVLINAVRNYTLHSNNCSHGLKSQFAIITCLYLKPVLQYIDILIIISTFPCSTCISSFFWKQYSYLFVHFLNVFSFLRIRRRNGDFLLRAAHT